MSLPVTCKRCMALAKANGSNLDFTENEDQCPEEGLCFTPPVYLEAKRSNQKPPNCPDDGLCFDSNDAEFWLIKRTQSHAARREVCPMGVSCPRNFGDKS